MSAGKDKFIASLLKAFPNEEKAILKWLDLMKQMKGRTLSFFAHKFLPLWFVKLLDSFGLTKSFFPFFKDSQKPLRKILDEITTDEDLKAGKKKMEEECVSK